MLWVTQRIPWARWAFYITGALLALWLVWAARAIWFPVAIAFAIAMVLDPTVDRLENRGVPRGLATAIVFLFFLAVAVLALVVLTPAISSQAGVIAQQLSHIFPDPERPDLVPVTQALLDRMNANPLLRDALVGAARTATLRLSEVLQSGSEWVLLWAPNLVWFLVVPVLAFYLLNDFHRIYAKSMLLIPPRHRSFAQTTVAEVTAVLGSYLRGLAVVCTMLGIVVAAMLFALGNPYWGLLGLIAGLLYMVPVVGSLITLALIVTVSLLDGTPTQAAIAGSLFLMLYLGIFDQIITPRVLGKQVGLHPSLTILAFLIGYEVWGVVGMLVAVPLAASFQRVLVRLVPKLRSEFELSSLEALERAEEETRQEHLEAEESVHDEHRVLNSVVENLEGQLEQAASGVEAAPARPQTGQREAPHPTP